MEKTLFNREGNAVAYITDDYHETIYLLDGHSVAYIFEDRHVYGINGRHLGWFINEIIFNHNGERIGFTTNSCPVPAAKEPVKAEKYPRDEIMPKWMAPALPNLKYNSTDRDFEEFLKDGQVVKFNKEKPPEA